jgi:hypothetical protein
MITFTELGNKGRIGNQIFQCSATISLATDNEDKYIFPPWKYEKHFNINNNCFSSNIKPTHTYIEPYFHYTKIPFTDTKDKIVDISGYWQSYKYFEKNDGLIKSLLTPKDGFPIKWDTTSIHVRHGDYLSYSDSHPVLDMSYYKHAMDMIKSKRYLIVSDDIEYCKKNFIGEQFEFSEADEITDLKLQISCEHSIIANSSFSYWSAYLNKNPNKIVIAPKTWFGPKLQHDTKDLCPESWLRI